MKLHYTYNASYALYQVIDAIGQIIETCLTEFEAQMICTTGRLTA